MTYLFDPANWEWLITGNNARFILEGFSVNLQIALISIVFSLIFGLLLALGRLSSRKPVGFAAGAWIDVWRKGARGSCRSTAASARRPRRSG